MIGENDAIMSTAGELLFKYHVDNFEGMVPDTIALIVMDQYYYDALSEVNVEFSEIYATGDVPSTSASVATSTTTTTANNATTTTQPVASGVVGDVNVDGKVNSMDLILVKRHISNSTFADVADLTGDSKVNSMDVFALKKIIANA